MAKIGFIGSCLSGLVAEKLSKMRALPSEYQSLTHLRSHVLLSVLKGEKQYLYKRPELLDLVKVVGNSEHETVNLNRINSREIEAASLFVDNIKNLDTLIIDNNYDLPNLYYGTKRSFFDVIYRDKTFNEISLRSENYDGSDASFLDVDLKEYDVIVNHYKDVFTLIHDINPNVNISFLIYPASGFEMYPELAERRVELVKCFSDNLKDLASFVNVFSPPQIPINCLRVNKGPLYFKPFIYECYAKEIFENFNGSIKKSISSIQNQIDEQLPFVDHINFSNRNDGNHPYETLPERNYWRLAVSTKNPFDVNKIYNKKYCLNANDKIATCGSCFAQHIGRNLKLHGFNVLDVEPPPPELSDEQAKIQNFGIYSARYGNVYTTRQLLQLLNDAFSEDPIIEVWETNGRFYDAIRPGIKPGGFDTYRQAYNERKRHLLKVKKMFQDLSVFVFTLGLTETWENVVTGKVYSICPGVMAGKFNPKKHNFINLSFDQVYSDLSEFWEKLQLINPSCKLLLTVSPVPLTATAENRHVLTSNSYSKSVLRAVAGDFSLRNSKVDYFPSYEIITNPSFRSIFYQSNLRDINSEGVKHVMSHFFLEHSSDANLIDTYNPYSELCDEILLDIGSK